MNLQLAGELSSFAAHSLPSVLAGTDVCSLSSLLPRMYASSFPSPLLSKIRLFLVYKEK
jgi:hypothetical protein